MSSDPWIDLPDGFGEAHSNTQSAIPHGDNGEGMAPSSGDNTLRLNDSYIQEEENPHVSDG